MLSERESRMGTSLFPEVGFYGSERIPTKEIDPASLDQILVRFVPSFKEPSAKKASRSWVIMVAESLAARYFSPEVSPPGEAAEGDPTCPHYQLVLLGYLLTGQREPEQIARLNQTLCGTLPTREDSIGLFGPLTGRRGTVYESFSRCWVTVRELRKLVEFMKKVEELPPLPSGVSFSSRPESEQRNLLETRERVRRENQQRGLVIGAWAQVLQENPNLISDGALLIETGEKREEWMVNETAAEIVPQFDIGGDSYKTLVNWIEEKVLKPLTEVVGKSNRERTADHCPKRRWEGFVGEVS